MTVPTQRIPGELFVDSPSPRLAIHFGNFDQVLSEVVFTRMSDRQGLTLIEGPVGIGKTMLLACLSADPKHSGAVLTVSSHRKLTPERLVALCCNGLDIEKAEVPEDGNLEDWLAAFALAATNRSKTEGSLFLLVDRAESLSAETVAALARLSELRLGGRKLLHPVLVLDCEDDDDPLPEAYSGSESAIAFRYWLGPMSLDEVESYIAFRLERGGYEGEPLFTEEAMAEIARLTGGIPGRINSLCREALSSVVSQHSDSVVLASVVEAARLLHLEVPEDARAVPESGARPIPTSRSEQPPKADAIWNLPLDDLVPGFDKVESELLPSSSAAAQVHEEVEAEILLESTPSIFSKLAAGLSRLWPRRDDAKPRRSLGKRLRTVSLVGGGVMASFVLFVVIVGSFLSPSEVQSVVIALPPEQPLAEEAPAQVEAPAKASVADNLFAGDDFESQVATVIQPQALLRVAPEQAKPKPQKSGLIFETQEVLVNLGYDIGEANGLKSAKTIRAIKKYQGDQGLAQNGRPSPELLNHMTAFSQLKEAVVRYHEKDLETAIESYSVVLILQPGDPDAGLFRGLAQIKKGDLQSGIVDIKQAVTKEHNPAAASFVPARVYYIQERLKMLGFDPGRSDGSWDNKTAKAIESYQRVQGLPLDPTPSRALLAHLESYSYHAKAIGAYRDGRNDEAMNFYNLTIALDPNSAEAYFNRGLLHKRLGETRAARQDYDNAIILDPGLTKAYYDRANIHLSDGRMMDAFIDYAKALGSWVGVI